MLQQTQVSRVLTKYQEFLELFPDFSSLSSAPLRDVLRAWQGLGYNRRALAIKQIARQVVDQFKGQLPDDPEILRTFPGIGPYTASAIVTIAFNKPGVFIETNIRTVFQYIFLKNSTRNDDRAILPYVEATLDNKNPREWYYALFDYGTMIKRKLKAELLQTNQKQTTFKGSDREIRGKIIHLLLSRESFDAGELITQLRCGEERAQYILKQLHTEGFIVNKNDRIYIK